MCSRIFSKNLEILTSALFQGIFDLEISIEIRQVHKDFIKLFYLYFVPSFLKDLNLLDKEKISVQKLYNTANQNHHSVINSYYQLINF